MTLSDLSTADATGGGPRPSAEAVDRDDAAGFTSILFVGALVSLISSLLYGYDTGVISGALLQIREEFDVGDAMTEVVAVSILVGAIIGALGCGKLS